MVNDLSDLEYEIMLDNPVADKEIAERAVNDAMAGGMDREVALELYGYRPTPIYYVKEDDILYRRRDGATGTLPDEVLWRSGWRPLLGQFSVGSIPGGGKPGGVNNQADPLIMTMISRIVKSEAQEIAVKRGLPTENWDPTVDTGGE